MPSGKSPGVSAPALGRGGERKSLVIVQSSLVRLTAPRWQSFISRKQCSDPLFQALSNGDSNARTKVVMKRYLFRVYRCKRAGGEFRGQTHPPPSPQATPPLSTHPFSPLPHPPRRRLCYSRIQRRFLTPYSFIRLLQPLSRDYSALGGNCLSRSRM